MDLEIDRSNKPGNIDELKKPENDNRRLRLSVESLDESTSSVASKFKYQYDLMKTYAKRGSTSMERLDRAAKDTNPPPDASLSEHEEKEFAFLEVKTWKIGSKISKLSEIDVSHAKRDPTMSDHNTNFCKPCRRIFDCNGSFVFPMTKLESGLYCSHWDAQMLKRSARSCPLCLLVSRAMGTLVTDNELIPLHYDMVGFLKAKHVYGVRFSYYEIIPDGELIVPRVAAQKLITIEAVESEWGLGSLEYLY